MFLVYVCDVERHTPANLNYFLFTLAQRLTLLFILTQ